MSKRIIDLGTIVGGVSPGMHLAVDTVTNTGAATIAECFGSMVNQGTPAKNGGNSFNINLDNELVLDHSINIPIQDKTTGGSINLWVSNDSLNPEHAITIDTYIDDTNKHEQGADSQYIRIHGKAENGQKIVLLGIDRNSGVVYKGTGPGSQKMVPLAVVSDRDSNEEIDALKKRIDNLEASIAGIGQLVHVAQTPIDNPVKGKLWWDTDTATLYVYDGAAWVQANIGAGYPGESTGSGPDPSPVPVLRVNSQTGVHDNANITIMARDGSTVSGFIRSCLTKNDPVQDESGIAVFDFDTTSKVLNISQTWSGGSGNNNKKTNTLTVTSTAQLCGIDLPYSGLVGLKAAYTAGQLIFTNGSWRGVWSADEYYYESSDPIQTYPIPGDPVESGGSNSLVFLHSNSSISGGWNVVPEEYAHKDAAILYFRGSDAWNTSKVDVGTKQDPDGGYNTLRVVDDRASGANNRPRHPNGNQVFAPIFTNNNGETGFYVTFHNCSGYGCQGYIGGGSTTGVDTPSNTGDTVDTPSNTGGGGLVMVAMFNASVTKPGTVNLNNQTFSGGGSSSMSNLLEASDLPDYEWQPEDVITFEGIAIPTSTTKWKGISVGQFQDVRHTGNGKVYFYESSSNPQGFSITCYRMS